MIEHIIDKGAQIGPVAGPGPACWPDRLIGDMPARDKVLAIAFCVCAAFSFGDHLAFAANLQPSIILPLLLGKLGGGICGFVIALWLSVPKALELEAEEPALADPQPA